MQQALGSESGRASRESRELWLERQARVGIIANPKELVLPVHAPREVWTRWPDLRSARRHKAKVALVSQRKKKRDPILSGDALRAFVSELREYEEEQPTVVGNAQSEAIGPTDKLSAEFLPPGHALRPYFRVGVGIAIISLGLIAAALLFG